MGCGMGLLGGDGARVLGVFDSGPEGMPGEGGALDSVWVLPDAEEAFEGLEAEGFGIELALGGGDGGLETVEEVFDFLDGFSGDVFGEEAGAGGGDGASASVESCVGDGVVFDFDPDFDLVSAEGVVAFGVVGRSGDGAFVPRFFAVVEDDFLVEVGEVQEKRALAFWRASIMTRMS